MPRLRIFLPSTFSLVTTTRSARISPLEVATGTSTSSPIISRIFFSEPVSPTKCNTSPKRTSLSAFGTKVSSPRLRCEQTTSSSLNPGISVKLMPSKLRLETCTTRVSSVSLSCPLSLMKLCASSSIFMRKKRRSSHIQSKIPQIPKGYAIA